jgi:trehalose 6-phosphate phosphatase
VLLAFDYDGTLAPIASSPQRARLRTSTRVLLQDVARYYPSIVISGRGLADISRRLAKIPLWYVFGNHGSEPVVGPAPLQRTDEWVTILQRDLPRDPGLSIENKGHSVTVHYRGARDREAVRDAIVSVASTLPDVRVVGGSEAINLLRRDAPDKGSALKYALRAFACDLAIYVGDDDTDEDAFDALPPDRLLPVRVGKPTGGTKARFHLDSQNEVNALLARLLTLRAPTTQRTSRRVM